MNPRQWTIVLWVVALISVFFGFYKLTLSEPASALTHFALALLVGFLAWRRSQKSG